MYRTRICNFSLFLCRCSKNIYDVIISEELSCNEKIYDLKLWWYIISVIGYRTTYYKFSICSGNNFIYYHKIIVQILCNNWFLIEKLSNHHLCRADKGCLYCSLYSHVPWLENCVSKMAHSFRFIIRIRFGVLVILVHPSKKLKDIQFKLKENYVSIGHMFW